MEDIKNEEKNNSPEAKKCRCFKCQCGTTGHKIIGVAIMVIVVVGLLCIGAVWGAKHGGRYDRFNKNQAFGCGTGIEFRQNRRQFNRGPRMMRGSVNIQNSDAPLDYGQPPINGQQKE